MGAAADKNVLGYADAESICPFGQEFDTSYFPAARAAGGRRLRGAVGGDPAAAGAKPVIPGANWRCPDW